MIMYMIVLLYLLSPTVSANEKDIARLYESYGVKGSLIIQSLDGQVEYLYNSNTVDIGFVPASTFKIPNTLIALEEGVIKDQFDLIKWDGVERGYAQWNKDQTLKSAFAISCVWCYQIFAREIGDEKYQYYLTEFDYGNRKTGQDVSVFWLQGDLRISVREQIKFLRRVYTQDIPLKKRSYSILKDIMLSDKTPAYIIWSKTGWAGKNGWYVGYMEVGGNIWLFAHHIEIRSETDLELRKKLVLEAFKLVRIIGDTNA